MIYRILTLFLLFVPELALAQSLFTPPSGDVSMTLLAAIFGSLGTFGAGGADPIAAGIQAFNGGVLVIGGVLVAYTIIAGTIGTAHDGEMLGKKFSSVWIPIRTALGTALVLPVINGTYCVMQAIVGWLIAQGIGLADNVWNNFASTQNIKLVATQGLSANAATAMGYNIFMSNVCMKAYNKALEEVAQDAPLIVGNSTQATRWASGSNTYVYGPKGGGLQSALEEGCGKLELPASTTGMTSSNIVSQIGAYFDMNAAGAAERAVLNANRSALMELDGKMAALADAVISSKAAIDPSRIDAAIKEYQDKIAQVASSEALKLSDFNTLSQNATADGWFMAGAFYTKIAFLSDVIHRSLSNTGSASGPTKMASSMPTILLDHIEKYNKAALDTLKYSKSPARLSFGVNAENNANDDWSVDTVINKLYNLQSIVIDDGEHPLIALKRIGNWILGIVASSFAAILVMAGAKGAASGSLIGKGVDLITGAVSGAGAAFDVVKDFWGKLLLPLIAVGIFLSYILPMMPYMIWLGATIGWLIMCVEAIIAAPMWAVMHLSPHGDDMVGTGAQGYRLVLSLMLRPVLMIFGLIAAFIFIQVVGALVTKVFFGVFSISQSESGMFIKLVGLIVAPIMYGFAMYQVIIKSFHLIHMIPDELLKWFGGGGSQLGQTAEQMGGEGSRQWAYMGNAANIAMTGALAHGAASREDKALGNKIKNDFGLNDNADKLVNSGSRNMKQMNRAQLSAMVNSYGGVDSEDGARFLRSFNEQAEGGASFSEAMKFAQNHTNEARFGEGASDLINRFSGGSYSSPEYKGIVSSLNNKLNKFMQQSGGGLCNLFSVNFRMGGHDAWVTG